MLVPRVPRLTFAALAATAVLLSACGSDERESGPRQQLAAWRMESPYLPPLDPSVHARPQANKQRPPTATSAADSPAAGAPSDAEIAANLKRAFGDDAGADPNRAAIDAEGLALTPQTAPPKLIALIRGANEVARRPYVYGGGHGRFADSVWTDTAYDCSGSVSYALASAGYIDGPMVSGDLERFGEPGPGKWVTIYANAGHTFMVVAGLRFDTSGRQRTGTRWQPAGARSYAGFVVRHPPGL